MAISIFIEYGGQLVKLPVNPESLDVKTSTNDELFEVLKLGEISEFGYTSLSTVEIDCFFPATKHGGSYILTKGSFWTPQRYIDFFKKIIKDKKPFRFIVSDTKINFMATITDFAYGPRAGTDDISYTLSIREYKEHNAKFLKVVKQKVTTAKPIKKVTTKKKQTGSTNKKITVGCDVIVNGRLHRDSYGSGPGQTEKNARRTVNFMAPGRKCPIHVRLVGKDNSNRVWRGWVTQGSVKRI